MMVSLRALVLGFALAATVVADQVAFNNFGPNDSYNLSQSYIFAGPDALGVDIDNGVGFNASASGPVTTVEAPLAFFGGANRFELWLFDDNNGLPGNRIYNTGPITGQLSPPIGGAPLSVDFGGAVSITAGERYYIVASATGNTEAIWFYSNRNRGTAISRTGGSGPFGVGSMRAGALRVTVVPEPATAALLAIGLGAGLSRRNASRGGGPLLSR